MKTSAILLSSLLLAGVAHAGIPSLNASCPGDISVHASEGGPVYLNGKEAKLKKFNDNYFEATGSGVTVSISVNPDGSPSVTYTGKGGANGVCQVAKSGDSSAGGGGSAGGGEAAGLDLDCRGSGTVTKTETTVITGAKPKESGLLPEIHTKKEHEFRGSVDVKIRPGAAKVRVPKDMAPPINSLDGDGWAEVHDFAMTDDKITGQIKIGALVKPTMTIDRRSGEITIDGDHRAFSGDCEATDADAKQKF